MPKTKNKSNSRMILPFNKSVCAIIFSLINVLLYPQEGDLLYLHSTSGGTVTRTMERGAFLSGIALDSSNPLLKAVFLRRLRLTRLLLEGGAYINESDSQGQTPLMVACRTQHTDTQSASRVKIVQFLLERGADPNIQDKAGCTALMHACKEKAGPEVVTLLLDSGADIGLEDQSGKSALVCAVMNGDWKVLKVLLSSCKAKGKEVIIIPTDRFPGGQLQAQQYFSMTSPGPLDQNDKTSSAAPASPSEIQLITSPQCVSSSFSAMSLFSFKENQACGSSGASSHPCSPSRLRGPGIVAESRLQNPLLRLNSEPWLNIPASLTQHSDVALSTGPDFRVKEEFSHSIPKIDGDAGNLQIDCLNFSERLFYEKRGKGDENSECVKLVKQKVSLPGLFSAHSASHPNLHSGKTNSEFPFSSGLSGGKSLSSPLHNASSSSLNSVIQRRKLGGELYCSDPSLTAQRPDLPEERRQKAKDLPENKRQVPSLSGESQMVRGLRRSAISGLERRGSGTFLLPVQSRPRALPPLNVNSRNTSTLHNPSTRRGLCEKEAGLKTFPSAPLGAPKQLTRTSLLRRHSLLTEQFKNTTT
ncbi:ankyrin repeat domain-containing protein 34B-like [Genypterus blacodes]|uniref:ankyrin repeat domain-containing protein 34B-like n=1 Tax=Genypterus blacodes TaxID=154954 RepID=UPI003F76CCAB